MRLVKLTVTPSPPAPLKKLLDERDKAQAEATEAGKQKDAAKAELKKAEALLAAGQASAIPELTRARDLAATKLALLTAAHLEATEALNIAMGRVATHDPSACDFVAKLELLPPHADPTMRFVAKPGHNITRDDSTSLKVNPAGLLTNGDATTVDRTSDIIAEFAGAMAARSLPAGAEVFVDTDIPSPSPDCSRKILRVFDPVGTREAGLENAPSQLFGLERLNRELRPGGIEIVPSELPEVDRSSVPIPGKDHGALYYRAPVFVALTVKVKGEAVEAAVVNLPQAGPVSWIPMDASAFVKTVDQVSFVDGSIASWDANRPSELLEIVRLPVKVLTSIVSIPASLLSVRVDYSSKEKALAENQAAEMKSAAQLEAIRACVAAAGNSTAATACFP